MARVGSHPAPVASPFVSRSSSARRIAALAVTLAVAVSATACASGSGTASPAYTTVPRTDSVRVRVIGDSPGAGDALVAAVGSTDSADYSVSASALGAWLDLPRENGDGAVHDRLVQLAYDDPDLVVASLGGDILVIPDADTMTCATTWRSESQRAEFDACVAPVLDRRLVGQRVMAIVFDVLAHTNEARLVLVGHARVDPASPLAPWQQLELAALLDARIASAAASVGESGATWADRVAYSDRGDLVATARARGWL